ncbi:SH3 domain-containing protein [uncultured Roseibium sp.]|uniref:SH3 domain-containing protein n=1 Tax=uncultured Roseibium sp. TaxID=1936171 RepID=UPI003216EEDA
MFKYSAPSTQPIVAPEFHGIPDLSTDRDENTRERPELTIVRASSAAPPRLRGGEAEDDGDLMIPEVLRKPTVAPVSQLAENAGNTTSEARFRLLPVAVASAAGLLLVLAAGTMNYAAGHLSNPDAGPIAVKTVSLEGQTTTEPAKETGPDASASAQAQALNESGFDLRFNSAQAADPNQKALKIKNQARVAKIPQEGTGPAGSVRQAGLPARPGIRSSLPVLGYASVPNPHAGWEEGQQAISAAARKSSAAMPVATPAAPAASANTLDTGPVTETASVTADVNLRSAAEKDAPVVMVVPKGSAVRVGSCDNWWCAVSVNGQSGFVGKKFVDGKG